MSSIQVLADATFAFLTSLRASEILPFLSAWPEKVEPVALASATVSVVDCLDDLSTETSGAPKL